MSSDGAFLAAASSIADRIVADAVWHGDRCNWTGAVVDPALPWRLEYRALEPNLYDGAAGVGLFLAQLAVVNGDGAVRRTARGALRQAIARAPALPPGRRDGFHAGVLGIAWAAAHAARLLDDDELWAGGRRVAAEAQLPPGPERCPDVIMGSAGTILALLALAELYDDAALFEDARAIGDELIDRARVTEHGWSWADPSRRRRGHLCGLSHGSAGIGWALLELFASTGDARFRTAAEGAFAYERSWFDAHSGTVARSACRRPATRRGAALPVPGGRDVVPRRSGHRAHAAARERRARAGDLPGRGGARPRGDAPGAAPGGAPGARRSHALPWRGRRRRCAAVRGGCAGWATAGGGGAGRGGDRALRRAPGDWPCGAAGGTNPSLFRGLSGIAWWLLRLHDPAIPSPLTLPVRG